VTAAADLVFAGIARQADARRAGGDERPLLGVTDRHQGRGRRGR
jgi:hypothetical protein